MRREDDVRRRNKWIDGTNDLFNISDHSHQWARHSADQCNVNKKERATLSGSVSATANVVKAAINTRAFIMLVSIIVNVCLLAAVKWMDEKLMDICDLIAIVSPFYTLYYLFFFLSLVFLLFFVFFFFLSLLLLSLSHFLFLFHCDFFLKDGRNMIDGERDAKAMTESVTQILKICVLKDWLDFLYITYVSMHFDRQNISFLSSDRRRKIERNTVT